MGLLDGRVAVVTGAGRGIGRAEALLFASEGASVVVVDTGAGLDGAGRDPSIAQEVAETIRERGGKAVAAASDVSQPAGAEAAIELACSQFGGLDALVNNAGLAHERPMLQLALEDLHRVVATGLGACLLCTQLAARQMVRQGRGGRIVNTTGLAGLRGALGESAAAAAAGAIYALTRTCAIELQKHRITVNALAPVARTRMTEGQLQMQGLDGLTPEHVAPAALFFASALCGDRTGETLAVAGPRVSRIRLAQSPGRYKDGDELWTAMELDEHWSSLGKP